MSDAWPIQLTPAHLDHLLSNPTLGRVVQYCKVEMAKIQNKIQKSHIIINGECISVYLIVHIFGAYS